MARSFDGLTQKGAATVSSMPSTNVATVSCWFYPTVAASASLPLVICTSPTQCGLEYGVGTGNPLAFNWDSIGSGKATGLNPVQNVWNFGAGSTDGSHLNTYLGQPGGSLNSFSAANTIAAVSATAWEIGHHPTANTFFKGLIAEAAIWSATLTTDELTALFRGVSPLRVRPGSLVAYWPLWGTLSPEPDLSGNQAAATLTGSPPQANHAPVTLFTRKGRRLVEPAGGTTVTVFLSPVLGLSHKTAAGVQPIISTQTRLKSAATNAPPASPVPTVSKTISPVSALTSVPPAVPTTLTILSRATYPKTALTAPPPIRPSLLILLDPSPDEAGTYVIPVRVSTTAGIALQVYPQWFGLLQKYPVHLRVLPMPYAQPTDMISRYDVRRLGDLVSDDGVRQTPSELANDPTLLTMLSDASGLIDAACQRGQKYTPQDLTTLTGASQSLLIRLCCDLAFGLLVARRGYASADQNSLSPRYAEALAILDRIQLGELIFITPSQDSLQSGVPVPNIHISANVPLISRNDRIFGVRRGCPPYPYND